MAYDDEESESDKHICSNCIGDFVVQGEIFAAGVERDCSYRGETAVTVAIEQISDRVTYHWLPEFLTAWDSGGCSVVESNFRANQAVGKALRAPS